MTTLEELQAKFKGFEDLSAKKQERVLEYFNEDIVQALLSVTIAHQRLTKRYRNKPKYGQYPHQYSYDDNATYTHILENDLKLAESNLNKVLRDL